MHLDEIRKLLKAEKNLSEFSREIGIPYTTLRWVMNRHSNPGWRTVEKLIKYYGG